MKSKYLAGFLLLSSSAIVHAQTANVSLYGMLDAGVEYVTNVGATGRSLTRMPSLTATVPSYWGLRGVEDLGGGQKAIFTLESGFALKSGASGQGGRLFGRQAFVGVTGGWGTVTIGRQYNFIGQALGVSNTLGTNIYGIGSLDAYIPNARADNAVVYRQTINGFTGGAMYSLGRDTVNAGNIGGTNCAGDNPADSKQCRAWSAMLKYDAAHWGVSLAQDTMNGGPGAFGGLTASKLTDTRTVLAGYYKLGQATLGAGILRRDNQGSATAKSDLVYAGAAYPVTGALTVDGQVLQLSYKDSTNRATLVALRGIYSLSKRTAVYVTAGHIDNDGASSVSVSCGAAGSNPAAGASQNGVTIGLRNSF